MKYKTKDQKETDAALAGLKEDREGTTKEQYAAQRRALEAEAQRLEEDIAQLTATLHNRGWRNGSSAHAMPPPRPSNERASAGRPQRYEKGEGTQAGAARRRSAISLSPNFRA